MQVPGGSLEDSFLVHGVAFKKTFAYAGFEQQPKQFTSPKVVSPPRIYVWTQREAGSTPQPPNQLLITTP